MKNIIFILFICLIYSCQPKIEEVGYNKALCQGRPQFLAPGRFSPNQLVALSTTENRDKGLWVVDENIKGQNAGRLLFQDSTWDDAGWLGGFLTDEHGDIWCVPVPVVNTLYNPTKAQNTLWRVDGKTGKMEQYLTLPDAEKVSIDNPYGIMAVTYNCEADVLYVTTVAGSSRTQQNGKVYCVNIKNKKIIDKLDIGDVFGIGMSYKDGFRKLYIGSARNSDIFSINLKENGTFVGSTKKEFSLAGLGPRGDDVARKIKADDVTGDLIVTGNEFKFNLTAPTELQTQLYRFKYNAADEKWEYLQ